MERGADTSAGPRGTEEADRGRNRRPTHLSLARNAGLATQVCPAEHDDQGTQGCPRCPVIRGRGSRRTGKDTRPVATLPPRRGACGSEALGSTARSRGTGGPGRPIHPDNALPAPCCRRCRWKDAVGHSDQWAAMAALLSECTFSRRRLLRDRPWQGIRVARMRSRSSR